MISKRISLKKLNEKWKFYFHSFIKIKLRELHSGLGIMLMFYIVAMVSDIFVYKALIFSQISLEINPVITNWSVSTSKL